jgi:hypothetical protein
MRERIIAEIKRVAAENGGDPPGIRTFLRETGIRRSVWWGRYWARWGDALREAGFEANELQPKTDTDLLLRKLAEASRHYGKIPTVSELRMFRNVDRALPTDRTIYKHFGSKSDMIRQLRDWLSGAVGFEDVAAMLPAAEAVPRPRTQRAAARDGYVYLLRSGSHYKIGQSDEIERRVKEIRVSLPDVAVLEHTIQTDDPSGIETYWHRRFADRRLNGEWFKLSPADVLAFKRRKFQ